MSGLTDSPTSLHHISTVERAHCMSPDTVLGNLPTARTCERHKAIKLNCKNTRTHIIVVLRFPSTIHVTWMPSSDVTWLTAHSGIRLLINCIKINYLLYSNCSNIWLLIFNGMSSNKPCNSFLREAPYVFPVKLLSNTKGPINLLPSTPHHTFTEILLWKLVTLVPCGLIWEYVFTFRKLFTPSRVKDTSSLNKMTLISSGRAFIQWQKSIRWAWSPGSRCCNLLSW